MHNFNLTTVPTASQNVTNLSILEESCNNNSYSYWVDANGMYDAGSSTFASFIMGTNTIPSAWSLPAELDSSIGFYVRRHSDWKCGSFDLKAHLQAPASTGSVPIRIAITPSMNNAAFQSPTFCNFTYVVAASGTMYTNTFISSALRVSSSVDRSKEGVYVIFERKSVGIESGLSGALYVHGIELIYNETKRVIGDTIKR